MLKELADRWYYLILAPYEAEFEKRQCIDEGRDFSSVAQEYDALIKNDMFDQAVQSAMQAMLDKTINLPMRSDYPYIEPSDLAGICRQRGKSPKLPSFGLTPQQLKRKLHGAWLGRCCGCLLGKPLECYKRKTQEGYLKDTGQWPLSYYPHLDETAREKHHISANSADAMFENLKGFMPADDDTNYTVIGLNILKQYGRDFKPVDVANYWLINVPMFWTCTAERIAYRNFANLILPPDSATYRNIYREWIGAQIRADFFGYVCPGNPELAAEFAWRDASISHVKNGIYGEMWVAAMLAASFVTDDLLRIIEAGLSQISAKSRLHESIRIVIDWYHAGVTIEEAHDRIHNEWDENTNYGWVHTISNAMIVASALLWGKNDYGKTICYAVQAAMDTDCNGATAGSIIGAVLGSDGIDAKWSDPINDTLQTTITGYNRVKISALADETIELIDKYKTNLCI
jgi:ADP-ribosylglycohydrolase